MNTGTELTRARISAMIKARKVIRTAAKKGEKIYMVEFISQAISKAADEKMYLLKEDEEKSKFKNTQY